MSSEARAEFGPVTVYFGEKSGKYPDGNQVIVTGGDMRVAFDTPRVANRIGPAFDEVDMVILGHVHEDHMAGLHRVPHAPVHVHEADVAAAREVTRQVLAEESSVPTWRRRVGADTTLDGCPLSAGTEVLLEVSGHHRPGDRDGFGLAFGHGLHRCLGAALAETEATHILHETARALPGARWSGAEPAWWRLLSFRTPLTVPALI